MATQYTNAWYAPRMSHIVKTASKAWENSFDEMTGGSHGAALADERADRVTAEAARAEERADETAARSASPDAHAVAEPASFVTGGKAFFTLRSVKTGVRYTYRVTANEKGGWFVSLLSGPDNWANYRYIGFIGQGDRRFRVTAKSTMAATATPVRAFDWTWTRLAAGRSIDGVEVWHEGKCARCGRKLTVPESIETGFGPECAEKRWM